MDRAGRIPVNPDLSVPGLDGVFAIGDTAAEQEAAARGVKGLLGFYGSTPSYKPVLDDADYRSFDSLAEYRAWCASNLPTWLGYGPAF